MIAPRTSKKLLALAFASVVSLPLGACRSAVVIPQTETCTSGGKSFDVGESFLSPDGCNTCTCEEGGGVSCTEKACFDGCLYGGDVFEPGASFPSEDGCNTCTCEEGGNVACSEKGCFDGCVYGGVEYGPGESFPSKDGCNTCSCEQGGSVICTEKACQEGCVYAGVEYAPGASFPALDGCNTCTCGADAISCTKVGCPCDPDKEWYRSYAAKSPAECQMIDFACPENTVAFGNSCGCGCEQDASCPEYFDCLPPKPCDTEALKKQCPYSDFAF